MDATKQLTNLIRQHRAELSHNKAIFFNELGGLRFANWVLNGISEELLEEKEEALPNRIALNDVIAFEESVPPEVWEMKTLNEDGSIASTVKLRRLYELGEVLSAKFRDAVFGKGENKAPHIINQASGGRLNVSSWGIDGKRAFALVIARPLVEWHKLVQSTVYAYTKGISYNTPTINNYFIKGMWEGYYEMDITEIDGIDPRLLL